MENVPLQESSRKIKIADGWGTKLKTYYVGSHCTTAGELYAAITEKLPDYYEVYRVKICPITMTCQTYISHQESVKFELDLVHLTIFSAQVNNMHT